MPTNHNPSRSNGDPGEYRAAAGDVGTYPQSGQDSEQLGYETTDVNIGGVVIFLAGLAGFLIIFFFFCFAMGKVINTTFLKEDGPPTKFNLTYGAEGRPETARRRENLVDSPEMQQRELQHMTTVFPTPRLDVDDGNQSTADLHAREDLLLNHYSTSAPEGGLIRIPIDRAMELIAQRGLPVVSATPQGQQQAFFGDATPHVTAPLTSGFARTGYELDAIEAREQKLSYGKAAGAEHAELQQQH